MKIIRSKYFPLSGYKAINLFGILFVKPKAKLGDVDLRHEAIHSSQYWEMTIPVAIILYFIGQYFDNWIGLLSPFVYYIWYGMEWLVRLVQYRQGSYMAYRNISFEREAYQNQEQMNYLSERRIFNFLKYK